jgi:hypothetical protein
VQVTEQIIDQYLAKEGEALLNAVEAQVWSENPKKIDLSIFNMDINTSQEPP